MDEYYKQLNVRVNARKNLVLEEVKSLTNAFLRSTETYQSLVSGQLATHFGFRKGNERGRLEPILNTFVNSIHYTFVPFARGKGSFTISGFVNGFSDVLSLPEALIQGSSDKKLSTAYPLPWLNWLLLQGDRVIVQDYHIEIGSVAAKSSRSGKAIMVGGGTWAVPELGGTEGNNWITDLTPVGTNAITSYDKKIRDTMERMF